MCPQIRSIALGTVLSFFFLTSYAAVAQTSLDDVHISSHAESSSSLHQAEPGVEIASASLIRTSTDLVLVPVSITDDYHRPVLGLDQTNFQVFENKKPQPIAHFSSEDTPVSIGIILDTSGSMANKLDWAREAVVQFCQSANPQDEFFMITFADEPNLASGFTTSIGQIESNLLTAQAKGRTALLDAVYMGIRELRDARYARKALLIISDGGDNHSRYSEHDVKAAVREADATLYTVGIFDRYASTPEEQLGPELLNSIANLTGGTAFTLSRISDLPKVTQVIGAQLRHEYVLAYRPQTPVHDRKWHKISIKLRLPKAFQTAFFHIAARPGYYAGGE
jgi:Ca-activated chloride channel family protein